MRRLLISSLVLALAAAGCGGDDETSSETGGGTSGGASAPAPEKKAPATAGATVVDMKNVKFMPENITIKTGDTVRWTNSDSFTHDVTKEAGPGEQFESGAMEGGDTFEQKFTTAGTVDYICTIHAPDQKGQITVE